MRKPRQAAIRRGSQCFCTLDAEGHFEMLARNQNSDHQHSSDPPTILVESQSPSVQSCNSPCNPDAGGETITLADVIVAVEFQAHIPPLADEDRRQLLINLERDGFRDPLVVWSQGNILLDGRNRLDIWRMVYGDKGETTPPAIRIIDLPDREAARRWIIANQLGRRSLPTMQRAELAMQLEPAIAEQAKQDQQQSQGRGKKGCPKSDNLLPVRTGEAAAKQAGIGKDTYRKAKEVMEQADPETLEKTRSGEISIIAYFQGHPAFEYIEHGNGRVSLTVNESLVDLAEKCERLEQDLKVTTGGGS